MNKPQILIIEDDNAIGNLISTTLETQHYQYRRAKNGASGVLEAASCRPDVILLDLGLPDMDGVDIIKKVRTWSNTPIIVISARSEDHDKVEALDAGANVDENGKLCGDVDYDTILEKAQAATPVPGGVGAVTTAVLAKHLMRAAGLL